MSGRACSTLTCCCKRAVSIIWRGSKRLSTCEPTAEVCTEDFFPLANTYRVGWYPNGMKYLLFSRGLACQLILCTKLHLNSFPPLINILSSPPPTCDALLLFWAVLQLVLTAIVHALFRCPGRGPPCAQQQAGTGAWRHHVEGLVSGNRGFPLALSKAPRGRDEDTRRE